MGLLARHTKAPSSIEAMAQRAARFELRGASSSAKARSRLVDAALG